jgi:hypothetical protein
MVVGGLNEEAKGFKGCAVPRACVCWEPVSVLAGALPGSDGLDAEVAGANGLPTGCLAVVARTETKGLFCDIGCCTAKPFVGVVPLNVVPSEYKRQNQWFRRVLARFPVVRLEPTVLLLSISQERWLIESPAECDFLFACKIKAFTYSCICREPRYAESLAHIKQ